MSYRFIKHNTVVSLGLSQTCFSQTLWGRWLARESQSQLLPAACAAWLSPLMSLSCMSPWAKERWCLYSLTHMVIVRIQRQRVWKSSVKTQSHAWVGFAVHCFFLFVCKSIQLLRLDFLKDFMWNRKLPPTPILMVSKATPSITVRISRPSLWWKQLLWTAFEQLYTVVFLHQITLRLILTVLRSPIYQRGRCITW